jgi:predicted RNA binding protein YcfA (HicA-like mRNA interferase family)
VSAWGSHKARVVFRSLQRIGWGIKSQKGSHLKLIRPGWGDFVWAFHEDDEIGPCMLARIAKQTGLQPKDL